MCNIKGIESTAVYKVIQTLTKNTNNLFYKKTQKLFKYFIIGYVRN